jgi:hypothetical protein
MKKVILFLMAALVFYTANAQRQIDILRGLNDGSIKITTNTMFDIGRTKSMFDGNIATPARSPGINPLIVTLEFPNIVSLSSSKLNFGTDGLWTMEIATSASGPYVTIFTSRPLSNAIWDTYTFSTAKDAKFIRITTTRTVGDNFVHLNEWQLFSNAPLVAYKICPDEYHLIKDAKRQMTLYGFDTNNNGYAMPSVTWVSSNPAIASVNSSGLVTAIASTGTVTITGTYLGTPYTSTITIDASFAPVKAPKKIVKVALIMQDPQVSSHGNQRLSAAMGWLDPVALTNSLIQEMTAASDGTVEFQVAFTANENILLTKIDGELMTANKLYEWYTAPSLDTVINGEPVSILYPYLWKALAQERITLDYNDIINQYDLCNKRNNGDIDEVWVYGHPYTKMYESRMTGPTAFPYNSPPLLGGNNCAKLMVIMGYNYERGVAEAMHSTGHRSENAMTQAYGRWEELNPNPNNFEIYTAYNQMLPGKANVGNIHFPPNGTGDYDYVNTTNVTTYADNWATYPLLQNKTRTVNCNEWQCDHLGYMRWWFGHLPRWTGETDGIINDWWKYIVDYEGAIADAAAIPECYFSPGIATNNKLVDDFVGGDGLPGSMNDLGFTIETWRANAAVSSGILSLANVSGSTEVSWTSNCGNLNYKIYGGIEIKAKASSASNVVVRIGKYTTAKTLNLTTNMTTFWIPFAEFGVDGSKVERITIGEFNPSSSIVTIDNISFGHTDGTTNNPPVITSTAITTATKDVLYSYTLTATDADPADVLTYSAPVKPVWLSFNASTRVLSGTPTAANIGTHAVTLRVNDGKVNTDQSFVITVSSGTVTNKLVDDFVGGDGLPGSMNDLGFTIESWKANLTLNSGALTIANLAGSTEASWTTNCGGLDYSAYLGIEIKAKAAVNTTAIVRIGKYNAKTINLTTTYQTFWLPWSNFSANGTAVNFISVGEFAPSSATLSIDNISFGSTATARVSAVGLPQNILSEQKNVMEVFPNPFQNNLAVKLNLIKESLVSFDVFTIEGTKIISTASQFISSGEFLHNIEVSNLIAGVYYVRATINDAVLMKKVVKLNE